MSKWQMTEGSSIIGCELTPFPFRLTAGIQPPRSGRRPAVGASALRPAHCREQGHARDPGSRAKVRADGRPRPDLRGARYGKETDRLRSTSSKQACGRPLRARRVRRASRVGPSREIVRPRRAPHGARQPGAGLSWRKPAEGLCSWKTLRSCPFGAKSGSGGLTAAVGIPAAHNCGRGNRRAGHRVEYRRPIRRHGAAGFPVEPILLPQGRRDPCSAATASLPRYLSPRGKLSGHRQRRTGQPRR